VFTKRTIHDIDLAGKRVLLRADYNVPVDDDGKITSDFRICASLPTLKYLLAQDCSVVVCSHLGRPKSATDKSCSLKPVAKHLSELLGQPVDFAEDCIGEAARAKAANLKKGGVLLLENLRFHKEEEKNDPDFAKALVADSGAEVFVQDGFGVVHRAHASIDAVTRLLPSVAGDLLAREMMVLTSVIDDPKRPLMAIVGGAKIADKIGVLYKFIELADVVAIGGAMANTFLLAEGVEVGESLVDKQDLGLARSILQKAREQAKKRGLIFYLPQDGVVATTADKPTSTRIVDWDAHVIADVEAYPRIPRAASRRVKSDEMILDIGPFSGAFIAGAMQLSATVIWNGTLGVAEAKGLQGPIGPFAHGTEIVIEALMGQYGHKPLSIIGGGDTAAYVTERGLTDQFNHVSTGGGVTLDLLAGKKLPGVECLEDKG